MDVVQVLPVACLPGAMFGILIAVIVLVGGYLLYQYLDTYRRSKPIRFAIREMEITEEWTDDLPKDVYNVYTNRGVIRVKKTRFERLEIGQTYTVRAAKTQDDEWQTFGEWEKEGSNS